MAQEPILDLTTLIASRPPIRVDGVTYYLKSPEELTLFESQQFTLWGAELESLGKAAAGLDALGGAAATASLEALVNTVAYAAQADLPDAVFAKLSGTQRMAIIEVFTGLLLGRRLRLAGVLAAQVTAQPTGANSSPASNSSSAATPAGGSTAPQQPS